jgi:hypothetical protein
VDVEKIRPILPRFSKSSGLEKGFTEFPAGVDKLLRFLKSVACIIVTTSRRLNRRSEQAKHRQEALIRFWR